MNIEFKPEKHCIQLGIQNVYLFFQVVKTQDGKKMVLNINSLENDKWEKFASLWFDDKEQLAELINGLSRLYHELGMIKTDQEKL